MNYLHLLLFIATLACKRIVRRLVHPSAVSDIDTEMVGWLNIMATCDDHRLITHYARTTYT